MPAALKVDTVELRSSLRLRSGGCLGPKVDAVELLWSQGSKRQYH